MAEEDEIDILGDFSFNSCFAQNNQGIPSCSSREDTVHPQWLLDSPAPNWSKEGPSRKLSGTKACKTENELKHTVWSHEEREILKKEMVKHGRNVKAISQSLTSKTCAEIEALIQAEHGIHLDTVQDHDNPNLLPYVGQEEIVTDDIVSISDVITMVTTASPTVTLPKEFIRKKTNLHTKFGDNSNLDSLKQKEKMKTVKKIGNHRRKVSKNYDKTTVRNKSKELKSPARQRNDSSLSEDSTKMSPKLQIVLGSGQALHVSEGEEVIKIEKKKDSEQESDIEIDIDSDTEQLPRNFTNATTRVPELAKTPIDEPIRKLDFPKRRRKINLNGGGGYRILHTEAGDVYEISTEPRKERQPRKPTIQLNICKQYGIDKPAPCEIELNVSVLLSMDIHAHTSQAEVMGLIGGRQVASGVLMCAYAVARAAANSTHCDMDPVSQAAAGEHLTSQGLTVCGWHHSHPHFPALPSHRDLNTQRSLQAALEWQIPFFALLTSPASAPHFRCFRVEDMEEDTDTPIGYELDVKVVPDLTLESLSHYVHGLKDLLLGVERTEHSVDMNNGVCPHTGVSYLDKCVWSVSRHMRSAGYGTEDLVVKQLIQNVRDIFR
ncbi:unnamed protein product [Leptosia nina]|uniref:MPN domain-containing protein n=1 Tax=Leptosia nina TaxID=320188 RepID=A0AAV1JE73_9NEOP